MNTHNVCFEQKYEKYQSFLSVIFQFLDVKFSIYLNRRAFVMYRISYILKATENLSPLFTKILMLSLHHGHGGTNSC